MTIDLGEVFRRATREDVFFFGVDVLADDGFLLAAAFGVAFLVDVVLRDLAEVAREAPLVTFFTVDFAAALVFFFAGVFFAVDFAVALVFLFAGVFFFVLPDDAFRDAVVDFLAVDLAAPVVFFFFAEDAVVFFAAGFFAVVFFVVGFIVDFFLVVDFFAAGFAFDLDAELFAVVFFEVVFEAVFFLVVAMRSSLVQKFDESSLANRK